ncbi:PaaI family thioesterase [Chloroflexus sp.]|uniref:PaaI family thioesterase n=1 Tax=Chloroflexus sp. TaxID=1904827 RepID=UPI00298F301B|nr:PaaI family thioesterase [Chloroflexus sp.]MCS6889341.1 PaaI family thioesterase [Chloroflexus sp.]MCX7859827.1 PaaI family thioesterase [Chloroflexus sp.]MDW8405900.1 PaaI family thioesterase [Chloroflexus sp.]
MQPIQDTYPDELSHCYGCGRLNPDGLQIKSVWNGNEAIARFTPHPYHTAVPGYVYGGLLASLIDCHGTGTAAAAAYAAAGREPGTAPYLRYLTASLRVNFLKPTPLGPELVIHGRVKEMAGRKVVVEAWIEANGETTVQGEVVAVQAPDYMIEALLRRG